MSKLWHASKQEGDCIDGEICDDCIYAVYGDLPLDVTDEDTKRIKSGMVRINVLGHINIDKDARNEFSIEPCICCESELGGTRHKACLEIQPAETFQDYVEKSFAMNYFRLYPSAQKKTFNIAHGVNDIQEYKGIANRYGANLPVTDEVLSSINDYIEASNHVSRSDAIDEMFAITTLRMETRPDPGAAMALFFDYDPINGETHGWAERLLDNGDCSSVLEPQY